MRASLRYVAGLGPALSATRGSVRTGTLVLDGTDPEAHVVVDAGETVVVSDRDAPAERCASSGPSVELVEALSFRAPLTFDVAEDDRWLLGDLGTVFDAV